MIIVIQRKPMSSGKRKVYSFGSIFVNKIIIISIDIIEVLAYLNTLSYTVFVI